MTLRVAHCIPSIEPSYGGPVAVARGLCRTLSESGISVTVFTSTSGNSGSDLKNAEKFGKIKFDWSKPWLRRYYWRPFEASRLAQAFRDFDIVHVHGVFNGLSAASCRAAQRNNIPYLLVPFGTLSPYCLKKSAWLKKISLAAGERKNIEKAALLQFSSALERSRMSGQFHLNGALEVPNGLDWEDFASLPSRGVFRKEWKVPEDTVLWLFVGRLQPIKGLEPFLKAFILFCRKSAVRHQFLAVGPDEGGYRNRLEKLVKDLKGEPFAGFTGALYGHARVQAMADSDIFVLPSFHENFGIAAAEAMACRKPVLVSEHADISQAVRDNDAGEVTGLEAGQIEAALQKIFSRRASWQEMGSRGRQWADENCRWEKIGKTVLEAYEKIMREKSRG